AWAACGAVAFAALAGTGRLLTASPTAAKWLGVAIFIAAGIYQLTPWKDWCLRRCRSPIGALMYYLGFKGRSRDVRVGLHHGATCAGCCWGLMIVLIAVGVMNVAVMAALAVVIFAEKLWRYGKPFGQAVGVVLVAVGVLAIWFPWLLPGRPSPSRRCDRGPGISAEPDTTGPAESWCAWEHRRMLGHGASAASACRGPRADTVRKRRDITIIRARLLCQPADRDQRASGGSASVLTDRFRHSA